MTCQRARSLLSDDLESLLPSPQACGLALHLACCPGCRRVRADMTAADAALRGLAARLPSRDLRAAALTAWAADQGAVSRKVVTARAMGSGRLRMAVALVASISLLALVRSDLSDREQGARRSAGIGVPGSEDRG